MLAATSIPVDRRQILALLERKPKCAFCGKVMFTVDENTLHTRKVMVDRNRLDELIAWCRCPQCGKISSLSISSIPPRCMGAAWSHRMRLRAKRCCDRRSG